jgi:hypothetical protein
MNSFDSIKFEIPEYIVQNWDKEYFDTIERKNNLTNDIESYQITGKDSKPLPIGLNQVIYSGGKFVASLSAKILKDNYLQGINLNTINQVVENIMPVLKIDIADFLENNIKVRTIDCTNNINIESIASRHNCIYTLNNSVKNAKYVSKIFKSKKTEGVTIVGNHIKKHRLIAYNKSLDLLKNDNKIFMQSLINPGLMIENSNKILRIEANYVNLSMFRNYITGVDSTTLNDCLHSKINTNHKLMLEIAANGTKQLTIFDTMRKATNNNSLGMDGVNQLGFDFIIIDCKFDEKLIKLVVKELFPNENTFNYHWSKKENNIKSRIHQLRFAKENCTTNNETILSQILTELKNQ